MTERKILKEYEELTVAEKAAVDNSVEQYKQGCSDPEHYSIRHIAEDDGGEEHVFSHDVSGYKGITSDDVMAYMAKFAPHIARVNEKLDKTDRSANEKQNEMRMKLFEDRWKKGYYSNDNPPTNQAPVNVNINNADSAEVKALKEEVSSLKGDINDLKQLLIERLK